MLVAVFLKKILDPRAIGELGPILGHANDLFESPKKQNAHTHAAILAPTAFARASFLTPLAVRPSVEEEV
jgi:hypothetical protein